MFAFGRGESQSRGEENQALLSSRDDEDEPAVCHLALYDELIEELPHYRPLEQRQTNRRSVN